MLWDVLRIFGMEVQLLKKIRSFYKNVSASVYMNWDLNQGYGVGLCVRQGCLTLPCQFTTYINGCMKRKQQLEFRLKAVIERLM